MYRRVSILLLLLSFCFVLSNNRVRAEEKPNVSIFDVKQEKVVKVVPLTSELQDSVLELLRSSPILYGGFSMDPQDGMVLHVPFPTPVQIKHELYPSAIQEVYIFLEQDKQPRALIFFAAKQRPIVVVLSYDARKFMERNQLKGAWNS
ncbi:hypothetical protein [Cohnella sp.]|uniref:hypothetical protein n=1 Tax=Cohnella sp. TaxID=1883426 RepID=UPI003564667E